MKFDYLKVVWGRGGMDNMCGSVTKVYSRRMLQTLLLRYNIAILCADRRNHDRVSLDQVSLTHLHQQQSEARRWSQWSKLNGFWLPSSITSHLRSLWSALYIVSKFFLLHLLIPIDEQRVCSWKHSPFKSSVSPNTALTVWWLQSTRMSNNMPVESFLPQHYKNHRFVIEKKRIFNRGSRWGWWLLRLTVKISDILRLMIANKQKIIRSIVLFIPQTVKIGQFCC